jgi:MoaA/NifB/PqqE/SkfB family radical SAM enzyme
LHGTPSALYSNGWHLITAPTGDGKTLLMNIIQQKILKNGGFGWANIDEFKTDKIKSFELRELFKDGEQKFRLNKYMKIGEKVERCKLVIIDELNREFNRRMNKSIVYNNVFVPMIAWIVTIRHQLCDRGYLIGQSVLLQDGQISAVVKYRHDVYPSKKWQYYFFREKGQLLFLPKYLKVEHFKNSGADNSGNIIWKPMRNKSKIKVEPKDFESYNTYAFAEMFIKLPEYTKHI